jgi:lipopolysaccharide/colanic/teichoic acid biosynthesis glycosyltransferase
MLYRIIKRFLDIVFSSLGIVLFIPLFLIISLLIWLYDRGTIFVPVPRRLTGENRKEFFMYKFRSMKPNAHEEMLNNPEYSDIKKKWLENDRKLKISEDPRITPIGKVLRKTDLDELPQLINVLKGDMSIVGPRPMYSDEIVNLPEEYSQYLDDVFSVKPGITSLWAVSGRNEITFKDRLKLEAEYAQDQFLLLDLKILLKTPKIVITREGAYE